MDQKVEKWIDAHREELITALRESIFFPSIDDGKPLTGAPFGKACHGALQHALSLCEQMGFAAKDLDGYIGYAEYGEGEEMLGILTHLDVVPAGEGWAHDPFGGEIVQERVIGRGTLDDKGPAMAAIFALAAVKAAGYSFRRRVRLIFGCDEEKSMRCLSHYSACAEMPSLAFAPDASYPLVNSEKNIFSARYSAAFSSQLSLKSGTVVNVVPNRAEAVVPFGIETVQKAVERCRKISETSFSLEEKGDSTAILSIGKAAHASTPSEGCNALQAMLLLWEALPLTGEDKTAVSCLVKAFGAETDGAALGLKSADESGALTLNVGLMNWNAEGFSLSVDIRAPRSVGCETLLAKLDEGLFTAKREDYSYSDGYYVPEDHELVRTLLSVYRERTGSMTPPLRIGGGTYARHLTNAVAFGPEREGKENLVHMANESISIEDLTEDAKMYAQAIIALATKK